MVYAIIYKDTDRVDRVCTHSANLDAESEFYEVETDHVFNPPVFQIWWKYDSLLETFSEDGTRVHMDDDEQTEHLTAYMTYLAAQGFSGNALDIDELEAWWSDKIDAVTTLEEMKTVIKDIIKIIGRSQSATLYGWKIKKTK